jgi:homoserine kinase type II
MAVFTPLDKATITRFISQFPVGKLIDYQGIDAGSDNTNYFVCCQDATVKEQKFVLTLCERIPPAKLGFVIELTLALGQQGLPVPYPLASHSGLRLHQLAGKPILLVQHAPGQHPDKLTAYHYQAIGKFLGQMHHLTLTFPHQRPNRQDQPWRKQGLQQVSPALTHEQRQLLAEEINRFNQQENLDLPTGAIHSDLFPDNTLFDQQQLTGVIDFYFACTDYLLYDLAVTVNAWCAASDTGQFDLDAASQLIQAYQQQRPLTEAEKHHWPGMLRLSALNWWLYRLIAWYYPRLDKQGQPLDKQPKDPTPWQVILSHHQQHPYLLNK